MSTELLNIIKKSLKAASLLVMKQLVSAPEIICDRNTQSLLCNMHGAQALTSSTRFHLCKTSIFEQTLNTSLMIAITYLEQKVEQLNLLTWSSLS